MCAYIQLSVDITEDGTSEVCLDTRDLIINHVTRNGQDLPFKFADEHKVHDRSAEWIFPACLSVCIQSANGSSSALATCRFMLLTWAVYTVMPALHYIGCLVGAWDQTGHWPWRAAITGRSATHPHQLQHHA